jgi:hypothetical protein
VSESNRVQIKKYSVLFAAGFGIAIDLIAA